MAEVSQALRSGVFRYTVLNVSYKCSICAGGNLETLPTVDHVHPCDSEQSRGQRKLFQVQTLPGRPTLISLDKVFSKLELEKSQECQNSLFFSSSRTPCFISWTGSRESLKVGAGAPSSPSLFQNRSMCVTMSPHKASPHIHTNPTLTRQQLRGLCTSVFTISGHRSTRLRHLTIVNLDSVKASVRCYSWKSDEVLLHRSRTAYYDILKVSPNATQAQIKTAYYRQCLIHHPDKNPDQKEAHLRFAEVSEAYMVLGNIALRRKYDRGILSQSDVQSGGGSTSKKASSKPESSPREKQQQQRSRQYYRPGGKPIYDFDAFYRAHYGEQLQREKMKLRKKYMEEMQKEQRRKLSQRHPVEVLTFVLVLTAGILFANIKP